jgi:hypothetical protein
VKFTDVEFIALVVDSFDDESQRRTDGIHILAHDLLDDGCFARVIEPSGMVSNSLRPQLKRRLTA